MTRLLPNNKNGDEFDPSDSPYWPSVGAKIKAKNSSWAFHTNTLENGQKLKIGEYYTVKTVDVLSSWCCITVEEFPGEIGEDGEVKFGSDWLSLSFFEWPNKGLKPPMTPAVESGNTIGDGFGSEWDKKCEECGEDATVAVRPGKAQCNNCG